jgi:hypothetical protein
VDESSTNRRIVIESESLIAWQCTTHAPVIRVATQTREWMDKAHQRFPYRCLPLVIANSFGWDILNPLPFSAYWNGGPLPSDVKILFPAQKKSNVPQAHFGSGVLTFTLGHLFKTPPNINLYVKGPPNYPKDGIIPLEGIVETDSAPATFTMNYLFTRKNSEVVFEAGEPYCRVFPIPRFMTEVLHPELRMIEDNPELNKTHLEWRSERDKFNKGLAIPGSEYTEKKWQKDYFQGGGEGTLWNKFINHQTRLHQPEFEDFRPEHIKQQDQVPDASLRPVTLKSANGSSFVLFIQNFGGNGKVEERHAKSKGDHPHPVMPTRQGSTPRSCPAGNDSITRDSGGDGTGAGHSGGDL